MASRANPIADTFDTIPGYPETLKVYRIAESKYWYMRAWMNDRMVVRTTKKELKSDAVKIAKEFYNELLLKKAQNIPLTEGGDFEKLADGMVDDDRLRVARGERSQSLVTDAEYILKKDMTPFFKNDKIKNIDYERISAYVKHLQERGLSSQTIKNHFIVLRKTLTHAHRLNKLDKLPFFPTVSTTDNPREWFTDEQFEALRKAIRKAIKDKVVVRYVPVTDELMELTNFTVNTFLRPQDIKILQHKHVQVVKKPTGPFLRIMAKGKVKAASVVSKSAAVSIYERLAGDPEAYVFFPGMLNRNYAMSTMSKQFKYVLEKANLYETDGAPRTLYSLRHTCIMNQLLHGKWSIYTLAKNCRTSVEMIERFYGSHLQAEMNIEQLHKTEEPGSDLDDFFEEEAPPT